MVFMTYANVVYSYGTERFAKVAAEIGMDGLILPDVPFEEHGLDLISLIAPTSHERIAMIAKEAEGFLYCVSSIGVTGTRSEFTTDFDEFFGVIKKNATIPCAVGFGISGPEQAKKMSTYCDGVIVGSAIVKLISQYGKESSEKVYEFTKSLRDALDE